MRLNHSDRLGDMPAVMKSSGLKPIDSQNPFLGQCRKKKMRNRLFMAAAHSLYSLYVNTQGVAGG
jgi:hypothetical protein